MVSTTKVIINTIVRVLPIGLYLATLLTSMLMENKKGIILFLGHLLNDIIGLAYRFLLRPQGKMQCAIVRVGDIFYTLPAPYVQVVAYYFTFFMMDMYETGFFDTTKFLTLASILLITIWSRMDVECKTMLDVIFAFAVGCGMGMAYYYLVRDYYHDINKDGSELDQLERNSSEAINDVFKFFE